MKRNRRETDNNVREGIKCKWKITVNRRDDDKEEANKKRMDTK